MPERRKLVAAALRSLHFNHQGWLNEVNHISGIIMLIDIVPGTCSLEGRGRRVRNEWGPSLFRKSSSVNNLTLAFILFLVNGRRALGRKNAASVFHLKGRHTFPGPCLPPPAPRLNGRSPPSRLRPLFLLGFVLQPCGFVLFILHSLCSYRRNTNLKIINRPQ